MTMKMTIKLGQDEIKEAIRSYVEKKLADSVKPIGTLKVTMVIHDSYSSQYQGDSSSGYAEAEIEIPIG